MRLQPSLVLLILYCPAILSGIYILALDFSANWKVMATVAMVAVFHAPAIYRITEGKSVSIPWYYYTVEKEDSLHFKQFSVFLLIFPVYLILMVRFIFLSQSPWRSSAMSSRLTAVGAPLEDGVDYPVCLRDKRALVFIGVPSNQPWSWVCLRSINCKADCREGKYCNRT